MLENWYAFRHSGNGRSTHCLLTLLSVRFGRLRERLRGDECAHHCLFLIFLTLFEGDKPGPNHYCYAIKIYAGD
jgi:hypothetical protein